jgi:sarcosine oxidase/L-pipecolate oxidase
MQGAHAKADSSNSVTAEEIQKTYPFKNLPSEWMGLYAPDNGVINVQLLLRTLLSLAKDYGADAKQHTQVDKIVPSAGDSSIWDVETTRHGNEKVGFKGKKIVIASGAYVNQVLNPSFGISLDLDIWEMTACYFNVNAGPQGTIFPSMWFQFAPDKDGRSQLFYGFPTLPWGPPNVARISVDAATRRIKDPSERQTNVVNPDDIKDTQEFVKNSVVGVDSTVPASTLTCLQTNVFDNMFVLDYVPQKYLNGGLEKSVVVFTAGWAMKFVPLLGKALAEMALNGESQYAREEFSITRKDKDDKPIIVESAPSVLAERLSAFSFEGQASGSSVKGVGSRAVGI